MDLRRFLKSNSPLVGQLNPYSTMIPIYGSLSLNSANKTPATYGTPPRIKLHIYPSKIIPNKP